MADHLKFYINGEWVNPLGSETIEVVNPSDESVIGSIAAGTKEDIDPTTDSSEGLITSMVSEPNGFTHSPLI